MANRCYKCGTTEADTYRFCSTAKDFVCIRCERICQNYSQKMLPNGVNCKLLYSPPGAYIAPPSKVEEAKAKYEIFSTPKLNRILENIEAAYRQNDDREIRAALRIKIAALKQLIEGRQKK